MADPVIRLSDAHLTLQGNAGPVPILRCLSLQVERGETVGQVGPSGSGKSSLLMLMGGLERATGGLVQAMGQDLTALDEDALARFRLSHMGVVFQSFHLIPTMTALENVATPWSWPVRPTPSTARRRSWTAWALVRGATITPRNCRAESSSAWPWPAPRRRARPSCWRTNPPAIWTGRRGRRSWICCSGCAPISGATLVLVTHDPDLARRCDRVIRLADGRLAAEAAA